MMLRPLLLTLLAAGCGKKNTLPPPPPVGWHREEGWTMDCYYPPDFAALSETDRRLNRASSLSEAEKQWAGERESGLALEADFIEEIDTVLLGRPEKIEAVVQQNLSYCKQVAAGTGSREEWTTWLSGLPAKLTAGECLRPFDFTMFDYLDIGQGWQRSMTICQGNKIRISGSVKDRYRITDKGPWITVEGDTTQPTSSGDWPCTVEGCYAGMLIMRFVSDAGVETIYPVGAERIFTAPEHGQVSYRINDNTFYDNTWFQQGTMIDRTSIEMSPAD